MKSMRLFGSLGGGWTSSEADQLIRAVRQAPMWCSERPWVVDTHRRSVELYRVRDTPTVDGDTAGTVDRRRSLSCGAALTNLRFAVRVAGWHAIVELGGDDTPRESSRTNLIAVVRAGSRQAPTAIELARFEAIGNGAATHVIPPPGPLDPAVSQRLAASHWGRDSRLAPLTDPRDAAILAEIVLRNIQRLTDERVAADELSAWSTPRSRRERGATGVAGTAGGPDVNESWLRSRSAVAARIASDQVLAVVTSGDATSDHIAAGAAIQSACLAAHAMGLSGQPVVDLLNRRETRAELGDRLGSRGYPQALLRIGMPAAGQIWPIAPHPRNATNWS